MIMNAPFEEAEAIPQPGMYLGNYRILTEIGHGGYATVYLAELYSHHSYRRRVAIKVLRSSQAAGKFTREALFTSRLSRHPHIVHFEGQNMQHNPPYIILEYAAYGSLARRYPAGRYLSPALVLLYVQQVASALQYMHQRDMIHCDVKPDNILLREYYEICLSDFGITQKAYTLTERLECTGTAHYMAPEQIDGYPCFASDQYALAVTAYLWLVGRFPFNGASKEEVLTNHLSKRPASLRRYRPELPQSIDNVIQRALAKRPEQRFATVWEFAQALRWACEKAGLVHPSTT
jgi:serine/threonine protein kinase